jgi:hypothetical protein
MTYALNHSLPCDPQKAEYKQRAGNIAGFGGGGLPGVERFLVLRRAADVTPGLYIP